MPNASSPSPQGSYPAPKARHFRRASVEALSQPTFSCFAGEGIYRQRACAGTEGKVIRRGGGNLSASVHASRFPGSPIALGADRAGVPLLGICGTRGDLRLALGGVGADLREGCGLGMDIIGMYGGDAHGSNRPCGQVGAAGSPRHALAPVGPSPRSSRAVGLDHQSGRARGSLARKSFQIGRWKAETNVNLDSCRTGVYVASRLAATCG